MKRKKAFILVVGIIIAAGALFTAVYDVLYRYNSSNTINLNAATVENHEGEDSFYVIGNDDRGGTVKFSFDNGTYMLLFNGANGKSGEPGTGAVCLAFYKADGGVKYGSNTMRVEIGVGGGKGSASTYNGGGCTRVETNFALPGEYRGDHVAIAAGAGGGNCDLKGYYPSGANALFKVMDGTFAGWGRTGMYWDTMSAISSEYETVAGTYGIYPGSPATQFYDGKYVVGDTKLTNGQTEIFSADFLSGDIPYGMGGGAGYFNGGGACASRPGGGGSCTPWCYPIMTSDIQNGPKDSLGKFVRNPHPYLGHVRFYRLDPEVVPTVGKNGFVEYGGTATLTIGGKGPWGPFGNLTDVYKGLYGTDFDSGLRTGWVYSVSEDGKSWQGVGPDGLRSATKQDI